MRKWGLRRDGEEEPAVAVVEGEGSPARGTR
jgi:hypothetical protein